MIVALHLHHLWGYKIAWGSVSGWFGSVLTGASLILGFYILLSNRRKDEWERASRVTFRPWQGFWKSAPDHRHISVINGSDSPISRVVIMAYLHADLLVQDLEKSGAYDEARSVPQMQQFEMYPLNYIDGHDTNIVEAGIHTQIDFFFRRDPRYYDFRVEFLDVNGIRWVRDLRSGHLHRKTYRFRTVKFE